MFVFINVIHNSYVPWRFRSLVVLVHVQQDLNPSYIPLLAQVNHMEGQEGLLIIEELNLEQPFV